MVAQLNALADAAEYFCKRPLVFTSRYFPFLCVRWVYKMNGGSLWPHPLSIATYCYCFTTTNVREFPWASSRWR